LKTGRKYTDMYVDVDAFKDNPELTLNTLRRLGFKSAAITHRCPGRDLTLVEVKSTLGLELASRLQIKPKNRFELLKNLRVYRSRFEVIGVKCLNMDVARIAVRDSRVDVVSFPLENPKVRLTDKLAKLCEAAVEITVKELTEVRVPRHLILQRLRNDFECASSNRVRLIVSSGASSVTELASPMDLSSIPAVLGVEKMESLRSVSEYPYTVIQRNKMKLGGTLIGNG